MRPPQRCFSGDWKARRHATLPIGIDYLGNWPMTLSRPVLGTGNASASTALANS